MDGRKLDPHRYRRVMAMVATIAERPGWSRRQLSDRFHISERQVQADIAIVQRDLGLPLGRRGGYRFTDGESGGWTGGSAGMTLAHILTIVTALRPSARTQRLPEAALAEASGMVALLAPPHLRPLAARMAEAVAGERIGRNQAFAALGLAIVKGKAARLSYPSSASPVAAATDVLVKPEHLIRHQGAWLVLGTYVKDDRVVLWPIDAVEAVELVAV
jgi:predicted DNA-binding transcriptional regulator YafY